MKKKMLLIIMMLLMVVGLTGCFGNKETKKEELGTTREKKEVVKDTVIEDKEIEGGIKAVQTNLVTKGGHTELTTEIKNETSEDKYIKYVDIIVKDSKGEEVDRLIGYVGSTISAGGSYQIVSDINEDLSRIVNVEYEINY